MIKWIFIINELVIQTTSVPENNNVIASFKYDSLSELVTIILLSITCLLVVLTPLLIIYFWVLYSKIYLDRYRSIFSVKNWISGKSNLDTENFNEKILASYRKNYSIMVGFGVSFLAYAASSIRFLILKFEDLENGLVEYFKFPFFVLDEIGFIGVPAADSSLNFDEFWSQMLLIVVISGLFFLTGFLIGNMVVDFRFKNELNDVNNDIKHIKLTRESFELLSSKQYQEEKKELQETDYI